MTASSYLEKWASGLLGVVCLVLLLNLVFRDPVQAGTPRPAPRAVVSPLPLRITSAPAMLGPAEGSAEQSALRLDLLDEIQQRPLPRIGRNPFEYGSSGTLLTSRGVAGGAAPGSGAGGVILGPPPLPAVDIKALGMAERVPGEPEALLADEEDIYIVREGQPFAKRFRVVRITATMVEIEDVALQRTVQLPMAP
jgi:hypothetical protein